MIYALGQEELDAMNAILKDTLFEDGVHCVCLIDMAGNIVVSLEREENTRDIHALAALSAGNFGAVNSMAKIIGEQEFSLLFHKGDNVSIHFSKVLEDFLLITIFGQEISLGFLRLKVAEATDKIREILRASLGSR